MEASVKKLEITPKEPCYLCGHAIRTELSEGVLDPLFVTVLLIKDNKKINCFVSFDLIMLDLELSNRIKELICSQFDIQKENIVLSFTHTHASPEIGVKSVFNEPNKGARPGYREFLISQTIEAVSAASQAFEEVEIYYTSTWIEGYYSNRNNKDRECDKSANMIKLVNKEQDTLALMLNMSCHSTVLGPQNYLVSADLFGALRTGLSKYYGCEVLMLQGASGDMGNRQYRQGNDELELRRMREGILPQLEKEFEWKKLITDNILYAETHYLMDYEIDLNHLKHRLTEYKERLAIETDANEIKLLSSGIKGLENVIHEGPHVHLDFYGKIIGIGSVVMVCIPCELFNQLGAKIKTISSENDIFIWGYCDYSVGYLVEEEEYGKSYESIATQIKKGMPEKYVEYLKYAVKEFIITSNMQIASIK